jgi:hypothetical protein
VSRRRPVRRSRPTSGRRPAASVEHAADGDWHVRAVTGSASTKPYRCPGCQQTIVPATPHVVAWPVEGTTLSGGGLDERRHWHTSCWRMRERRGRT